MTARPHNFRGMDLDLAQIVAIGPVYYGGFQARRLQFDIRLRSGEIIHLACVNSWREEDFDNASKIRIELVALVWPKTPAAAIV